MPGAKRRGGTVVLTGKTVVLKKGTSINASDRPSSSPQVDYRLLSMANGHAGIIHSCHKPYTLKRRRQFPCARIFLLSCDEPLDIGKTLLIIIASLHFA